MTNKASATAPHSHCVTCRREIDIPEGENAKPLLVCDDNDRCYRDTPGRYLRWNGFKYVPDHSRAETCEDECPAETAPQ